jgi:hypothetical protein
MADERVMELETINKLYLELAQVATAKTARELELEDVLRSAHAIAARAGKDVHWRRFSARIEKLGIGSVTPRTFRVLASDLEGESQ